MKNNLIILSSGMDSVTLLYDQKDYIALAVTFDYGSNHNKREAELAAYHCKQLGIDYSKTYPCYKGGKKHCDKYGTCVEYKEALRDAGINDA